MTSNSVMRRERDALGELEIPDNVYYGIHTMRAVLNFPFSKTTLPSPFIKALGQVKRACAETNTVLGHLNQELSSAIITACKELEDGKLSDHIVVDAFQGGAGTSTNMNVNEVIANRAEELLGGKLGEYTQVHPLHHVNMHQSTNDVYPTALKVAALGLLVELEEHVARLQESLQAKEAELRDVVKVARTELMDGVPMTLGMTFSAFSDAVARDRWRIFKSRERIKKVNLGGTAIGTGLGAPRDYVLKVTETLRHICGLPVSRAENLVDATQNMDSLVEVSGMLKTYAANLMKLASDLRLLSSGPDTGIGEISLPPLQTGSSIMAGKINPVMPEAVTQIALKVMGNDQTIGLAAGMGQLELNHLMPLIAHTLLESLMLLINATHSLTQHCIPGIKANVDRCLSHVEQSNALATVLVPVLGYDRVEKLVASAKESGRTIREEISHQGIASSVIIDELLSPKRLCKLGFTPDEFNTIKKQ
nr:aspartate ammonia-lyase [uncultured Pseudodesulfovibrio sp.]